MLDQLIQVAEQRFGIAGVDGRRRTAERAAAEAAAAAGQARTTRCSTPPYEALDAGDFGGAVQAYKNVLADDPANTEAKLGLAQAELLRRVQGAGPAAGAQGRRPDEPDDVAAQIAAADLDLVGGHVEDAFGRLVDTVRRTAGEDRDAVRVRLLELFEVIGADDPRVVGGAHRAGRVLF